MEEARVCVIDIPHAGAIRDAAVGAAIAAWRAPPAVKQEMEEEFVPALTHVAAKTRHSRAVVVLGCAPHAAARLYPHPLVLNQCILCKGPIMSTPHANVRVRARARVRV